MKANASTVMTARGWSLFVVVAVLWGIPYLFITVALDHGVGPISIAASRVVLGALTLLPLVRWTTLATLLRHRWRRLLVLAAVQIIAPFTLISIGELTVSSSLTGVLIAAEPLFVVSLGLCIGGVRRPDAVVWTGLAAGLLGVIILLGTSGAGAGAPLVLAAAACYGMGPLLVRRWFTGVDSRLLTTALLLIAASPLLVAAVTVEPLPRFTAAGVAAVAVLGIACTAGGFAAFFALIQAAGPVAASVTAYVAPVVAVLAGTLVLHESITIRDAAGIGLILAGAFYAARRRPAANTR